MLKLRNQETSQLILHMEITDRGYNRSPIWHLFLPSSTHEIILCGIMKAKFSSNQYSKNIYIYVRNKN